MRDFDFNIPDNARISPQLLMGAASPLWGYFAGAAMSGVAFWWMTRWTETVNLEALMAPVAAPEPMVGAVVEMVETAMEPVVETVEVVEAAVAETIEAAPEPAVDVIETVDSAPKPTPAARARKASAPIVEA